MKNGFRLIVPDADDLKKMRKKIGYTQIQLAELTGLSQSLIARIENRSVNPRLSTLKKIVNVLNINTDNQSNEGITAREIISNNLVIHIHPETTASEAIDLMEKDGISQFPVIDPDDPAKIVGSINEKNLMLHLTKMGKAGLVIQISEIMGKPFLEIEESTSFEKLKLLLSTNSALIVKKDENIVGIITKADLLRFYKR
jgi:predicted transcriptional regulator